MIAAWMWMSAVAWAGVDTVPLQGDFYGVRIDTPLRIADHPLDRTTPAGVLDADAVAFRHLADWVDASADAVDLDDYGRLRLVVTAVDALPVRVDSVRGPPATVGEALRDGVWTPEARLLAIGGGLRALGVAVTVFQHRRGELLLGVSCPDAELNVDAVEQDWRSVRNGRTTRRSARWVLWDGVRPVGQVHPKSSPKRLEQGLPLGRAMRLGERSVPRFALNRVEPRSLTLRGMSGRLPVQRRPDAAGYLSLAPELKFASAMASARDEVRWLGLDDAARRALRHKTGEVERLNTLIRLVQAAFTYQPGPVRSMPELIEAQRGDCDQLSLLLGALLLELGYRTTDVVAVSWPDHLGLAVRPRSGPGPKGSVGVDLSDGRYHLIDVTHYIWRGDELVSQWGRSAPEHGARVTVQRLTGS